MSRNLICLSGLCSAAQKDRLSVVQLAWQVLAPVACPGCWVCPGCCVPRMDSHSGGGEGGVGRTRQGGEKGMGKDLVTVLALH